MILWSHPSSVLDRAHPVSPPAILFPPLHRSLHCFQFPPTSVPFTASSFSLGHGIMGVSLGSFPFLIKTSLSRLGSNGAHISLINIHSSCKLSRLHGFFGSEIYPAPVSNLRSFLEYPTASSGFPFELLELPPKYSPEVWFQHSSELTLSKYIQIITWLCLKLCDGSPPGMLKFSSVSSVAQSCPTLCKIMDYSTPGFLVHHQLSELAQTHVHRVGDAIQPSHPLSSPSPPAVNFSQHQGLFFASGGQSIRASASTSVHPMNIQDWFPLELTGLISLQSKGLSRVFSNITVQKHQFFGTQLSL